MAWERRDTTAAAVIAGLAFAVRAVQASTIDVIGGDSSAFLLGALEILKGDWTTGATYGIHFGYPLAIVLFGKILGNLETGAYAASVLFSSLATVPFYAMTRDMMGRRVAIVSALLFACLPYFILEHADIMSEGLFHFFFVTSVAFAWFGATRASWKSYALAGVSSALAYCTRPEGVYTAVAMVGITLLALIDARRRGEKPQWRIVGFAAGAVVLIVLLALPQIFIFHSATGGWKLTRRGSAQLAAEALGGGAETHWGGALAKYARQMLWASSVSVLLAIAGFFFVRRRVRALAVVYLLCLTLGYSLAPILAGSRGYPISPRYVLVPVLFLLPFASLAYVSIAEAAARLWEPRFVRPTAAVVLGLLLIALTIRAVHPREERESGIKEAAQWLVANGGDRTTVSTNTAKAWWYIGRRVPLQFGTLEEVRRLDVKAGEYAFVMEPKLKDGALQIMEARFRRVATFPSRGSPRDVRVSIFTP